MALTYSRLHGGLEQPNSSSIMLVLSFSLLTKTTLTLVSAHPSLRAKKPSRVSSKSAVPIHQN